MINYKTKFIGFYLLFQMAIGVLLGVWVANIIIALLVGVVFNNCTAEMEYIIQIVVRIFFSLLVMYLGIKPAAEHAAKKEDIPEYPEMKKFAIIFFGIMAVIQAIYNIWYYMKTVEQINEVKELYERYYLVEVNSLLSTVTIGYVIATVIIIVGHILMIPVTLKKYDV